jgi:hypothetical protein
MSRMSVTGPLGQSGHMRKIKLTKKRLPAVLLVIAGGLTAWVFELGAVLQGQAQVRNWSSVWVGLDLLEITGLVMTAVLMRRRSAFLAPAAAMTATAFALDAWFDVMTALPGGPWYESLASAAFGEVPMTIGLAWIAWRAASPSSAGRPGLGSVGRRGRDVDADRAHLRDRALAAVGGDAGRQS